MNAKNNNLHSFFMSVLDIAIDMESISDSDVFNKKLDDAINKLYNVIGFILLRQEFKNNDGCLIELIDDNRNYFTFRATSALEEYFESAVVSETEALSVKLNPNEDVIYCGNILQQIDQNVNLSTAWGKSGINSVIYVPLCYNKKIFGNFAVVSKNIDAFSEQDVETAKYLAGFINAAFLDTILFLNKSIQIEEKQVQCDEQIKLIKKRQSLTLDLNKFTIIDWTPHTPNIFGYSKDEIIGKNIKVFLRPQDRNIIENELISCVENNREWYEDVCIIKKDKSLSYYEMSITPHESISGKMIAQISVGRDITDKYLYDEKLKKEVSARKIVENEVNLYKQALDEIGTAVLIFDNTDKNTKFINEAFKQMHGYEDKDNAQFNFVNNNPDFSIFPIKNTKYCIAMKQDI